MKRYKKNTNPLLFLLSSLLVGAIVASDEYKKTAPTSVSELRRTGRTAICSPNKIIFVENEQKEQFVIKKIWDEKEAIHETAGATVLQSLGINTPITKIIPAGDDRIQKLFNGIVILQEVAPGKEIGEIKKEDESFCSLDIDMAITQARHLKAIAYCKKLAPIVAANIFLDDPDAHSYNIFYDKDTDDFHVIDKGCSFCSLYYFKDRSTEMNIFFARRLLATRVHVFLKDIEKEKISEDEREALIIVNNTLEQCLSSYSSSSLTNLWIETAKAANYTYSPSQKQYIKDLFKDNRKETKRVCRELNRLTLNLPSPFSSQFIAQSLAKPSKRAQKDFWNTFNA